MWIFVAGTGYQCEVDVPATATVAQLKEAVAALVDIPEDSQILLCGKAKLNSTKTLNSYGLPSNDKPIFVFNRKAFDPGAKPPEDIVLVVNNETPPQPTLSLQELAKPPELYKLRLNDHKLHGNLARAELLKVAINKRVELCKQSFSQQQVQVNALSTAIDYTNGLLENLNTEVDVVVSDHHTLVEKHERLLASFPTDLAKLREIVPHPALRVQQQTLLEIVNEAQVRAFADKCSKELYQLKEKMAKFVKDVDSVRPLDTVSWSLDALQQSMDRMFEIEAHTNGISLAISKDCQVMEEDLAVIFKQLSREGLTDKLNVSINTLQELSDKTLQTHINYLRLLEEMNKESASILTTFATSKNRISKEVHQNMQPIAVMSGKLTDMGSFFYRMKQAISRQKADFSQLKFVNTFPATYQACLEEISRRRAVARRYNNEVTKIQEKANRFLDAEKKRREAFFKTHSPHMPQLLHDLFPGLVEPVRALSLPVQQLDAKLPPVDFPNTPEPMADEDFIITAPPSTTSANAPPPPPRVQSLDTSQVLSMQEELAKVKRERDSYKERIKQLEKKLYEAYSDRSDEQHLEEQLSQYEKVLKNSCSLLPQTLSELQKLQDENRQLGLQVATLEDETRRLAQEIECRDQELQKSNDAHRQEVECLSTECREQSDNLIAKANELASSLFETKKEKASLESQLGEQKKQLAEQKEKLSATLLQIRQTLEKTGLEFQAPKDRNEVASTLEMFNVFVSYATKLRQLLAAVEDHQKAKISLSHFAVGDLAMFFPREDGLYQIFNKDCPGYFLADESVESFSDFIKRGLCIVGEIVELKKVQKGDPDASSAKLAFLPDDFYYDVIIMKYD